MPGMILFPSPGLGYVRFVQIRDDEVNGDPVSGWNGPHLWPARHPGVLVPKLEIAAESVLCDGRRPCQRALAVWVAGDRGPGPLEGPDRNGDIDATADQGNRALNVPGATHLVTVASDRFDRVGLTGSSALRHG